jgi:hypothetical protein
MPLPTHLNSFHGTLVTPQALNFMDGNFHDYKINHETYLPYGIWHTKETSSLVIICYFFTRDTCRYKCTCTMMKPHFKGKTASTNPMYSRSLIHPRMYESIHSSCIIKYGRNTLVCGITAQVSCTMVSKVYGLYPECGIMVFRERNHSTTNT